MYFNKILILFFIFCMGCVSGVSGVSGGDKHHHRNISLFNRNICRDCGAASGGIASAAKRTPVYYVSRHKDARQYPNHYRVFARDILRKYIYIVNVVVIYIILYSL